MVGGTGIEPCPLSKNYPAFKELKQQESFVYKPFIGPTRFLRPIIEENE
jgi:hypothetical protein